MKDFFFGFTYPIKSISFYLKNPKLLLNSVVPFIINLIIYGTIFFISLNKVTGCSKNLTGSEDVNAAIWQKFLNIILIILLLFLVLVICYLAFITLGNLLTAPFNEKISKYVEIKITNKEPDNTIGFWKDSFMSIKAEGSKIAFYLSILIPIFLLNLIPVIGSVLSTSLGILFSFFYNALDFLDYPMTRKFYTLRKKINIVLSRKMLSIGFGCCIFLMMFLPVINLFLKPVCVTAGTALFFERKYSEEYN
jgi:CysZ protein